MDKTMCYSTLNNTLTDCDSMSVIRGVCIVKCYNEKPLYKSSVGKILVYPKDPKEKKKTDIEFKQPPKEEPIFKEEVIRNVFKK